MKVEYIPLCKIASNINIFLQILGILNGILYVITGIMVISAN